MYLQVYSVCENVTQNHSEAWSQDDAEVEVLRGGSIGHEGEVLRLDLIARVQQEIAAGTYDTDEKFDVAMERLVQRMYRD